jgi:hypothetical protein
MLLAKKQAAERQNYVVVTLETTIAGDANYQVAPCFSPRYVSYTRGALRKNLNESLIHLSMDSSPPSCYIVNP